MSISDSDDTDILLLIPPNYFSTKVETDIDTLSYRHQHYNGHGQTDNLNSYVVKGILSHITELEDRVSTIETFDSARTSYYSDGEMNRYSRSSEFHMNSPRHSLNRTPTNQRQLQTCHSTPSNSVLRSNDKKIHKNNLSKSFSPQRNKIDNQSDTGSVDLQNTAEGSLSNLSTPMEKVNQNYTPDMNFDLPAIERLMKEVEITQKEFEEKLKQKEDFFNFGNNLKSRQIYSSNDVLVDKEINEDTLENVSVEPKAKRKLELGDDNLKNVTVPQTVEMTADVQELYKSHFSSQPIREEPPSVETKMMSLSELWKLDKFGESPSKSTNASLLRKKIEEEKYRREHCEQLIQQLQFRLLEEQEKVAVAMKVDIEKDKAIRTLQNGWGKLVSHWREIEEQRHNLANKLLNEKQAHQAEIMELNKKIERYEKEVSQTVNLAAGYKEKAEKADQDKNSIQYEAEAVLDSMKESLCLMEENLAESKRKVEDYQKDRKMLADRLNLTEQELEKERMLTKEAREELEQLKITLKLTKDRLENLQKNFEQEEYTRSSLKEQLDDTRKACEMAVTKELKAQEEIESLTSKLNTTRSELREFYQTQLNNTVKEKLKEFEAQLDSSELTMRRDFAQKEKTIAENAAKQLKQISERIVLDFKSKFDVYETECKRLKSELNQKDLKVRELNALLKEEFNKRELMTKKFEQVQQVINMINYDVGNVQTNGNVISSNQINDFRSVESNAHTNDVRYVPSETEINRHRDETDHMNFQDNSVPNLNDNVKQYIQTLLERPPGNPMNMNDLEENPKENVPSFLESSVTSDIFNEPHYASVTKNIRAKSQGCSSQYKATSKKMWK